MAGKDVFYNTDNLLRLQAATKKSKSEGCIQVVAVHSYQILACFWARSWAWKLAWAHVFRSRPLYVYLDSFASKPRSLSLQTLLSVFNRRAEVTLDGVWPTDKTSRCLIKSPERLAEMNYEGRLEAVSRKQGARFKEYRPETGSWVFKVMFLFSL